MCSKTKKNNKKGGGKQSTEKNSLNGLVIKYYKQFYCNNGPSKEKVSDESKNFDHPDFFSEKLSKIIRWNIFESNNLNSHLAVKTFVLCHKSN